MILRARKGERLKRLKYLLGFHELITHTPYFSWRCFHIPRDRVALRCNPLPVTSYEIGMTAKELKPTAVAHGPSLATYHVCTKVPQIPPNPTQNQCDHNPAAVRPRLSSFSVWRLRQSHVPSWRISKHEKGYVTWWKRDENVWWTTKTPALVAKYSDCYRCLRKVIWTRNFVRLIHIFNRSGKVVVRL